MESIRNSWSSLDSDVGKSAQDQALKAEKARILGRLLDPVLREAMCKDHREARLKVHEEELDNAQEIFEGMQDLSRDKNLSINLMVAEYRAAYDKAPDRMAFMLEIPECKHREPMQTDIHEHQDPDDDDAYVHYINEQASWFKAQFVDTMKGVCAAVNNIDYIEQLSKAKVLQGMDLSDINAKFKLPVLPGTYLLQPDSHAMVSGKNCGLYVGPVKSKDRGSAKVDSDYRADFLAGTKDQKPIARYVCDWLRCTIFTADPYVLALVYALLEKTVTIIRVKNNFASKKGDEVKRTNFLINFGITNEEGIEHVGEVQLTLQDYMTVKNEQHKYYEVERAGSITEIIFQPIFE